MAVCERAVPSALAYAWSAALLAGVKPTAGVLVLETIHTHRFVNDGRSLSEPALFKLEAPAGAHSFGQQLPPPNYVGGVAAAIITAGVHSSTAASVFVTLQDARAVSVRSRPSAASGRTDPIAVC